MEALSSLLCGPLFGKGRPGRPGFENAGGCLPPEGGPATRGTASWKSPAPVTFLLGPLKTPHKKVVVACVPCTFRTNMCHTAGQGSAVLISCFHSLGLCSAPLTPGPLQPRAPRGQHHLPAPVLATCVFAVFRLCPCESGPRLSLPG